MYKIITALFMIALFISSGCHHLDCNQLPESYTSYQQAMETIRSAHFHYRESADTSKSSWIRAASFYSCDGITGYFIFKTDKKEYLYKEVPYEIWEEFKNAVSFGKYYNRHIKGKYGFGLNSTMQSIEIR